MGDSRQPPRYEPGDFRIGVDPRAARLAIEQRFPDLQIETFEQIGEGKGVGSNQTASLVLQTAARCSPLVVQAGADSAANF